MGVGVVVIKFVKFMKEMVMGLVGEIEKPVSYTQLVLLISCNDSWMPWQ